MSGHILHILHHASRLSKDRGMMLCRHEENGQTAVHELPIEDIRVVIIAARGVSITPDLIAALMEANAVILHCDHSYKPIGMTSGVQRVVRPEAAYTQANRELKLHDTLWRKIIARKILNQARVLEINNRKAVYLRNEVENGVPDEASCARHYWQEFFLLFNLSYTVRHGEDDRGINAKLDYGYAVLGALVHRSIIAHGLSPLFGMHHTTRYQAHAMVYDLMEPWRPFVDRSLIAFEQKHPGDPNDITPWARHIAGTLANTRVETPSQKLSVLDAIDVFVSSVAQCYEGKTTRHLWIPRL